jgi:hypothetical protein
MRKYLIALVACFSFGGLVVLTPSTANATASECNSLMNWVGDGNMCVYYGPSPGAKYKAGGNFHDWAGVKVGNGPSIGPIVTTVTHNGCKYYLQANWRYITDNNCPNIGGDGFYVNLRDGAAAGFYIYVKP